MKSWTARHRPHRRASRPPRPNPRLRDPAARAIIRSRRRSSRVPPDPEAFIEALDPLQPRLYSIASSPRTNPGRVALTVDAVRYAVGRRTRLGVASTFLAGRLAPRARVKAYVQKAQGFGLPADP